MQHRAVLFDMDGTLLDTLADLRDGVNCILDRHGYPLRTTEEIRLFVGNGARELIRLALPQGTPEETMEAVLEEYRTWYRDNSCVKTAPYPGVPELLEQLRKAGVLMAVVSNKPHAVTVQLAQQFFPGLPAFGQRDGVPQKPAPDMVFHAMETLGVRQEETVYVGDSEVDVATARNAGLDLAAVSWGFRSREVLIAAGAQHIADTPEQLLGLL